MRYFVAAKLFRQLSAANADGSSLRLCSQLQKAQLLIIDDWGMERLTGARTGICWSSWMIVRAMAPPWSPVSSP